MSLRAAAIVSGAECAARARSLVRRERHRRDPRFGVLDIAAQLIAPDREIDQILVERGLGFMDDVVSLYPDESGEYPVIGERIQTTWNAEPDLAILSNPGMDLMDSEDQEWLLAHAETRDYIFLDPAYLLASANPNDTKDMMVLLNALSKARDDCGCAIVFTHQTTDKHRRGSSAQRLIGSTFMHGWCESGLFSKRTKDALFTIEVDNVREMGRSDTIKVQGRGVGSWTYSDAAQETSDALGRQSPQGAEKQYRLQRLRALLGEHPDWGDEQLASAVGVSARTIRSYRAEIAAGD